MGATDPIPIGCTAIKPVERHGLEAIKWFLYDKDTGAIMGRTPMSWLLITVFYIIYYTCLAGFWVACLYIFFQFVDDEKPRWEQENSLIGRSPALGVRPGQDAEMIESSMIMFNYETAQSSPKDVVPGYAGWVNRTDTFLQPYNKAADNAVDCAAGQQPEAGSFCRFDLASLGSCAQGNHGFDSNSPCLILKLNKIFGLVPDFYTKEDAAELPEDMPDMVKNNINGAEQKVWVSCQGENPADKEGMAEFEYFPADAGFPAQYFPYTNQKNYQSPLVAVKLNKVEVGQLLHIECRAWAKNINYNRRDRVGIVHFELMVHDTNTAEEVSKVA